MKLSQSKKQSTTNSYNKSTSTGNTNTNNHTNIGSNSYRNNHNSNTNNRTNTVTNTVTNIGNLNIQSSSKMNMELFEIREPKKSFFANWFQKPSNSFVFRMIVIVSLAIATACGGALIYYLLTYQETKLFRQNFELITDEAIRKINNYFERVEAAGVVIVKEYSHVFPDKETWPNVGWTGFSETTAALLGIVMISFGTFFSYFIFVMLFSSNSSNDYHCNCYY